MNKPIEAEVVGPSQAMPMTVADVGTVSPSVAQMLAAVVEKGVTSENVGALEKLVGLYERMQDRDAEKEFARAFVELQREIPRVEATSAVPNNDGTIRYTYAKFEEVDAQARPICLKHGFTYTFDEGESAPGKITKICTVQHVGGHKRSNKYTIEIGKGPPSASVSQAGGSAHSYAKRGALCDALCIVVRGQDNDARNEGGDITAAQAADLERRVKETGSNRESFLKFAGAKVFTEIPAAKYSILDENLRKRERTT